MWPVVCLLLLLLPIAKAQDPYQFGLNQVGTSFLNHSAYITSLDEPQWYLDNIPFVDFPDQSLQDIYYYRCSVIKRHLKYTHQGHGWSFTEFIQPVSWASKFQTIPDSAAHHLVEGRWLKNSDYVRDLIQLYTRAGVEVQTGITYTHYIQDAIYEAAEALGDASFLESQLDGMINTYYLWNVTVDNQTGLYHRTPLLDAQEYSLPGWTVGGPNGGPVQNYMSLDNNYTIIDNGPQTYRPNFNAYMVAGARSIATAARMTGNLSLSMTWNAYADHLYSSMLDRLYDNDLNFWIDVVEASNLRIDGRQLIGYFPFRFDVGTNETFIQGLEAGLTTEHFLTEFGPTTLEQVNPYFTALKNLTYCCLWQGQSWPFSTSVYLGTLARIARANSSSLITPDFFQQAMAVYTRTNYQNGMPYTAEAHYPTINAWSGDTTNHSEHYFHSTYLDNVFTNLLGIIPTLDDRLEMSPLVPSKWSYFLVEDLPYHGSLFTIVWDRSGSHYRTFNHSAGLSIFSNSTVVHSQPTLAPFNLTLSPPNPISAVSTYVNILSNPNAPYGLPNISADVTYATNGDTTYDNAFKMINGLLWYDTPAPDDYWTNNQSTTPYNTLSIVLPRPRTFDSISLAILDDSAHGGVLACPYGINITTGSGTLLALEMPWTKCTGNSLNTLTFPNGSATASNITITLFSALRRAVAISEVQIWVRATGGPRYEVEDGLCGTLFGSFEGRKSGMNASVVDGGVELVGDAESSWVELADVRSGLGKSGYEAGVGRVTVSGYGDGRVVLGMNYLSNQTLSFNGGSREKLVNVTVKAGFLRGGNVVTMLGGGNGTMVWIDAITVG